MKHVSIPLLTLLLAALACNLGVRRAGTPTPAPTPPPPATATASPTETAAPAESPPPTVAAVGPFGVITGGQPRPEMAGYLTDLGADWVRVNVQLGGETGDYTLFLDAGINVILTFSNRDPANMDTAYGSFAEWPNSGFPFLSKETYQQQVREALAPALPYIAQGRQVWAQAENEVGDAALNPKARYWRGTSDQYLELLRTFYEAVKSIHADIPVVLTSFPSESLDAARDPNDPHYEYASAHIEKLLTQGEYDAADLHFYGCVEDIPAKVQWVKDHMPVGKLWISTENGGPDPRCPTTPHSWREDLARFETQQAEQVAARLTACAESGGNICLWFSLFDLRGEPSDTFNRLGLLDQSETPPRKKPAYEAFKAFAAGGP